MPLSKYNTFFNKVLSKGYKQRWTNLGPGKGRLQFCKARYQCWSQSTFLLVWICSVGHEGNLSPSDDKHCLTGLAQASKKIKQCCNSFEGFWEENPTPGCFLALSSQMPMPVHTDLRNLWDVDCGRVSNSFSQCWYQKGSWLLKAHQEKSIRTRCSRTAIQWRSCSNSVLRARQKRLALSYKQPPAHPGKDIVYLPFPLPPADRFALAINLPLHPHRAFVSIPHPTASSEKGRKGKDQQWPGPKVDHHCSAPGSQMTWVDMLLPRHPHKSHLVCSVLSNLSMTSLNWAEHHTPRKRIFGHFSWW